MDIVVHQTGGVFGIDRKIEVRSDAVTVSHEGDTKSDPLTPADRDAIQNRAAELLDQRPRIRRYKGPAVSDPMTTVVLITDASGRRRTIRYRSGDDAPRVFHSFVSSVVGLTRSR